VLPVVRSPRLLDDPDEVPQVTAEMMPEMAADAPESNTDAIKLVESMPMGQFARFVGGDIPESVLNHFIALSVDAASGEND
jgi:beta-glucosidase